VDKGHKVHTSLIKKWLNYVKYVSRETILAMTVSNKALNKEIGKLGEDLAVEFLLRKGYSLVSRNVLGKGYEIDIIAQKDEIVHFVEVKSVSYETRALLQHSVLHETYQPEERVDRRKIHFLKRGIETWILKNSYTGNVIIDVIVVRFVPRETFARVKFLKNVIE